MNEKEFKVTNSMEDVEDFNEPSEASANPQKGKFNFVSVLLILVGVICIGVSVWGIGGIIMEYQKAANKYDDIENEFVTSNGNTNAVVPSTENTEVVIGTEIDQNQEMVVVPVAWYEMISVDLAGMQKKYPDIKGWIFFENEDISYPVVKGASNDTYLRATYDGKKATAGSIFIGEPHSSNFNDTHTILYGHNMRNLSMFGKLKYYRTQKGYYETHQYFQIFRDNEVRRYQIFAYQEVPTDSFVYTQTFNSGRTLANRLLADSLIKPDITIKDSDKIITLSTCTTDDDERFVVSAVLVDTYTFEE